MFAARRPDEIKPAIREALGLGESAVLKIVLI